MLSWVWPQRRIPLADEESWTCVSGGCGSMLVAGGIALIPAVPLLCWVAQGRSLTPSVSSSVKQERVIPPSLTGCCAHQVMVVGQGEAGSAVPVRCRVQSRLTRVCPESVVRAIFRCRTTEKPGVFKKQLSTTFTVNVKQKLEGSQSQARHLCMLRLPSEADSRDGSFLQENQCTSL